jgi:hypothetical protein
MIPVLGFAMSKAMSSHLASSLTLQVAAHDRNILMINDKIVLK